jgi:ribosomal protein L37AE/L43A
MSAVRCGCGGLYVRSDDDSWLCSKCEESITDGKYQLLRNRLTNLEKVKLVNEGRKKQNNKVMRLSGIGRKK